MPKPRVTDEEITPASGPQISLRPNKPITELSSELPLLQEGVALFELKEFVPLIPQEEGKTFNSMFMFKCTLTEPHPFIRPAGGEAGVGYPVVHSEWMGAKDEDQQMRLNRRIKEITEAFATEEELEEYCAANGGADNFDLLNFLDSMKGANFVADIKIEKERTDPKTGTTYPERNIIKKFHPKN